MANASAPVADTAYDSDEQQFLSPAQVTFFAAYAWTLVLWLVSEYLNRTRRLPHAHSDLTIADPEQPQQQSKGSDAAPAVSAQKEGQPAQEAGGPPVKAFIAMNNAPSVPLLKDMANSGLVRCLLFDLDAIQRERETLKAAAEFGALMVWYFLCDRTSLFASADKSYSRDLFLFLMLVLTAVAFGSSFQTVKQPVVLVRQQTEEWKGWMQVLFLLYHYFEAREVYNAIRIFIAAYVWMTGFGNFLYYYKTNDFCIGRFSQMMWRLNFLVFFACVVLRNSYMLYYICPMHTIYTVLVYASLGIASHLNQSRPWMITKLVLCVGAIIVLWDCKQVFYAIWSPLKGVMGYVDPRKPSGDELYEWYFRSSLDRYVWIYGMLCAYMHPWFSGVLTTIDAMPTAARTAVRSAILAACAVVGYFWYIHVYCLPKLEYNKVHPYTSWIPITLWIVLRNFTPSFRLHHLRLYGWLGCITLETYISQFHVWLKTGIPDGQPKALLSVAPGYPLINFFIVTAGYVFISHRLFELTNVFKTVAVPHNNDRLLLRNTLLLGATGLVCYLVVYGTYTLFLTTKA